MRRSQVARALQYYNTIRASHAHFDLIAGYICGELTPSHLVLVCPMRSDFGNAWHLTQSIALLSDFSVYISYLVLPYIHGLWHGVPPH